MYDLIGLTLGKVPRFAKRYAAIGDTIRMGIEEFCRETKMELYPTSDHCYAIDEETASLISEAIKDVDIK